MSLPNASDLLLAIRLLADTSAATKNIQILEKELEKLGVKTDYAKRKLQEIGAVPVVPPAQVAGVTQLNTGLGEVAPHAEKATKGLWSLNNVARTVLGTLTAMGVFLVTQFVGQAIAKATESLKQLELSLYRIQQSERALSDAGVSVNFNDIQGIADRLTELYTFVSDIDAQKLVGNVTGATRDLNLTLEQTEQLIQAIPVLALRKGISIDQAFQEVINGLTTSGRGWKDLWVPVDALIIKEEALNEKLVESEEAWNNLTAAQRQQVEVAALLSILNKNVANEMETIGKDITSTYDQSRLLAAEWENLSTVMGQLLKPIILLFQIFLRGVLHQSINGLAVLGVAATEFFGVMAGGHMIVQGVMDGTIRSLDDAVAAFVSGQELMRKSIYPQIFPTGAPSSFDEDSSIAKFLEKYKKEFPDTPTGDLPDGGDGGLLENQENIQKALEKMNNEILTAQLKLAQDMEDAQINLGRKLEDITVEYAKKRADAERDYANKVADIWASYHSKVADIRQSMENAAQEQRNRELENEEKFQEKMRQLKEDFLLNLEDALHARDARQVQRLIKQYELEKAQAEREHALEKKNNQRDYELRQEKFRQDLKQAERERQEKLLAAQRDYQDKLAKLAADEQAERDAAELAHQRKMEDLEREMQNRLEIVAAKLVEEFNLTKEGLDAITALYLKYYQDVSQIYAAMQHMMAGMGNIGTGSAGGRSEGIGMRNTGGGPRGSGGGHKRAEGGTMLANRPTTVTFGEAGLELATFTPIGRRGQDMNKLFTSMKGGGSAAGGGMMSLEVGLSPDLELRVVKNTLGQVATVIDKVRRSK